MCRLTRTSSTYFLSNIFQIIKFIQNFPKIDINIKESFIASYEILQHIRIC